MNLLPISPVRTLLIAQNTVQEARRQRLVLLLPLLALGFVAGARGLRDFNIGASELRFIADCGFGAMALFGAVLTITAAAQLFHGEIERGTVLTLLARPVRRAEFVLGKFVGVAALVAVHCALLTTVLAAVLWSRERGLAGEFPDAYTGSGVNHVSVVVAAFLQWLKLMVLAAFTLLVASFARTQLFTVIAGFFILVICHLQYLAADAYAQQRGFTAAFGAAVAAMFPNFQLFAVEFPLEPAPFGWAGVARRVLYALGYIAAACGLAVFSFGRREI